MQNSWVEKAREEYCFERVSYGYLAKKYKKHPITIQRNFDKLQRKYFITELKDKGINLCFDGVYFGWSLCYLVFRANGQTIYFKRCRETIANIAECLEELEKAGYGFKSFTIDGKKGVMEYLKARYPNVPIQYCQFHQKQTIRRYLTKEPKTECGQELKAFIEDLVAMDEHEFIAGLEAIKEKYKEFLTERNENKQYMHRRLRSAFRSLSVNAPVLFTYKKFKRLNIPNTSNTCEGYFNQIKRKVRAHPGLTRPRLISLIERLFFGPIKP